MKCMRCLEERLITHVVHSFSDDGEPVMNGIFVCYNCGVEAELLVELRGRSAYIVAVQIKRTSNVVPLGITCGVCHESYGTKESYKAHWEEHANAGLIL